MLPVVFPFWEQSDATGGLVVMGLSRLVSRKLVVRALLGLLVSGSLALGVADRAQPAAAGNARVVIYDNNGGFNPVDADTGLWGYFPAHIEVIQGESIEFVSAAGNFRPHSVTSLSAAPAAGGAATLERQLEYGKLFDSSPTRPELLMAGAVWTLDTTSLNPGHYSYFCTLHLWMVGSITVLPAQ